MRTGYRENFHLCRRLVTSLTQKFKKRKKAQDEEPILKTSRTLENGEFYAIRGGLRIKVSAERLI